MKLYLDTESSGLKGPLLLVQYSQGRGPIKIIEDPYDAGKSEMDYLLSLLKKKDTLLIGYNIGFDLGKLYQYYQPEDAFNCQVVDLWLKVLKLEPLCHYPFIGGKPLLVLKKIHVDYVEILEKTVKKDLVQFLPPGLGEITCSHRETDDPNFITLDFKPKLDAKLKTLVPLFAPETATEALKFTDVLYLPQDVKLSKEGEINGIGEDVRGRAWKEDQRVPFVRDEEIKKYQFLHRENMKILKGPGREKALKYARKDIEYLHQLEDFLIKKNSKEDLEPDYNDTITHIVAFTRYHGFQVDLPLAKKESRELEEKKKEIEDLVGINLNSSPQRKKLIISCLIPEYIESVGENIKKTDLPILTQMVKDGVFQEEKKKIIEGMIKYKSLCQVLKQFETILMGEGKFYPDFRVLGAFTDRMAGKSGFNGQGVSKTAKIRKVIKTTCAGDYDALEVIIAASYYQDENLLREIREGVDPHTQNVHRLFPQFRDVPMKTLLEIKGDKGHRDHKEFSDCRGRAKGIFFGILYGSESIKQGEQLGCTSEEAEKIMEEHFFSHYPLLKKSRADLQKAYCTADFDTWRKDSIDDMKRYVENLYGDRRYIDFEVNVAAWFWKNTDRYGSLIPKTDKRMVVRMKAKGPQAIKQTIRSACMGATSGIQKAVSRQNGNYPIQSTGAKATKRLMCAIWDAGYKIPTFNVHDEVQIGHHRLVDIPGITKVVEEFIIKEQKIIPYLSMKFCPTDTWAEI